MLKSLVATNYGTVIDLYVAHSSLTELDFKMIKNALAGSSSSVHQIRLDDDLFKNAPTKSVFQRKPIIVFLLQSISQGLLREFFTLTPIQLS